MTFPTARTQSAPTSTAGSEQRAAPTREAAMYRLAVTALALLPWLIAPGLVQPDTKVDLTISPWAYLARSLDAWNGHAGLGELQNQAYGYLFPMGPVFGVAHSVGLPPWAAQRIWWMILLLVAFGGVVRLVRALNLAGPGVALLAGATYALCPRVLTLLAENSSEAWPMAVAPWLVLAARPLLQVNLSRRDLLRALALSGALTAALGGVNAAASGLMLVLPGLYLCTDRQGLRRVGWWLTAVLLGALWWLLPLLVLGGYAYPFLDFIETASMTTAVTSVPNVLRGDSDWIAYILDSAGHPVWQSGWTSAQSIVSILTTTAVAGVGLAGVTRMRGHTRRFAVLSILIGTVFMTIGHRGVIGSPVATEVRALLDGSLAPLRNIHKADALIRLPVVLGSAVLLERLRRSRSARDRLLAVCLVILVAAAMTPLWQGRVADQGDYRAIPDSWRSMAHRIDHAAITGGGSTLLWPNARTGTYDWGSTGDDPMSALASSPIVVRAAAPLGDPSATRMLDTADQLAASGQRQPGLAPGLARMGIARIVVRHSLSPAVQAQPWSAVERTLSTSPGFRYAGSTGSGADTLTLWSVTGSRTATAYTRSAAVTVAGGPESVFDLSTVGALSPNQSMRIVGPDRVGKAGAPLVETDSLRWRTLNSGVPTADGYSPTLLGSDTDPDRAGSKDLPPAGDHATQPVRTLIGMSSWSVSSSGADPFARSYAGPGAGIAAAFDGDPATAWRTGDRRPDATLTFTPTARAPVHEVDVELAAGTDLDRVGTVRLSVGDVTAAPIRVALGQRLLKLTLPRPSTGSVRIDLHVAGTPTDPVMGVTDIRIPGQQLGSVITLPGTVDPATTSVLLRRDPRQHSTDPTQGEDPTVLTRRVRFTAGQFDALVWMRGTAAANSPTARDDGRCGDAGTLRIGNRSVPLRFAPAVAQQQSGGLVRTESCAGRTAVEAGTQDVSVVAGAGVRAELVYLHSVPIPQAGSPAAAAVPTRAAAPAIPARAEGDVRAGSGELRIGGGPARVVTLTQGFNTGWHGSVRGTALTPVRVDGWRQGFVLPAGGPTTVRVQFGPTWWQRAGLLAGLLSAVVLGVLFLVLSRGRSAPRPADATLADDNTIPGGLRRARWTAWAGWWAAPVVGVLCSGLTGAAVGVLCLAVPRRLLGRVIGGSLALAGIMLAGFGVVDQKSAGTVLGQLLGTVTVCLLARCLGSTGGLESARDAPAASPTSAPPSPKSPSSRPGSA